MKANELRIGNYLINFLGEVFEANGVTIGNFHHNEFGEPEPIPLTKEWLIKFGFEKEDDGYYCNNEIGFDVDINGITIDLGSRIEVKHVHQLQNLYFALTNKELQYEN